MKPNPTVELELFGKINGQEISLGTVEIDVNFKVNNGLTAGEKSSTVTAAVCELPERKYEIPSISIPEMQELTTDEPLEYSDSEEPGYTYPRPEPLDLVKKDRTGKPDSDEDTAAAIAAIEGLKSTKRQ